MCLQVESERSGRMHVSAISSSGSVTFIPCQGSLPVTFLLVPKHHMTGIDFHFICFCQRHTVQCLLYFQSRHPKSWPPEALAKGVAHCERMLLTCRKEAST